MRTPRPRDKEALTAKILLWIAMLCLLFPIFYILITNEASLTVRSTVLLITFSLIWVLMTGAGAFLLLLFLHDSYRRKTHRNAFVIYSALITATQIVHILLWCDIPLLWGQYALVALPALSFIWVLCRWVKLPVWLLRILNAIPGVLFTLSLFFDTSLGVLCTVLIAHILYSVASVLIIPKTVHTKDEDLCKNPLQSP